MAEVFCLVGSYAVSWRSAKSSDSTDGSQLAALPHHIVLVNEDSAQRDPSSLIATLPLVCRRSLPFPTHLVLVNPDSSHPRSFLVDRYASECLLLVAALPHQGVLVNPDTAHPHPSSWISTPPLVCRWSLPFPTTLSW